MVYVVWWYKPDGETMLHHELAGNLIGKLSDTRLERYVWIRD